MALGRPLPPCARRQLRPDATGKTKPRWPLNSAVVVNAGYWSFAPCQLKWPELPQASRRGSESFAGTYSEHAVSLDLTTLCRKFSSLSRRALRQLKEFHELLAWRTRKDSNSLPPSIRGQKGVTKSFLGFILRFAGPNESVQGKWIGEPSANILFFLRRPCPSGPTTKSRDARPVFAPLEYVRRYLGDIF
jgi:hypothetical protein